MSDDPKKADGARRKLIRAVERAVRKELGEALMSFMQWLAEVPVAEEIEPGERDRMRLLDRPLLAHRVHNLRLVLERAARQGVEVSLAWHTVGMWSEDWKERIGCFARALELVEAGRDAHLKAPGPLLDWTDTHLRAECLYEIGRVHAHEGDPAVARGFLERALPLAQEAERLRAPAGVTHEDRLEGKIAEMLVQLPAEAD